MGFILDLIGTPFGRISDNDLRWFRDLNSDPIFAQNFTELYNHLDSTGQRQIYGLIEDSLLRSEKLAVRYSKILGEEPKQRTLLEQVFNID